LNVRAENLKLDVFVEMANELFFNSKWGKYEI
jgi:hypothetical protein